MTPNNALTIAVASLVLAVLGAALLGVSGTAIGLTAPPHFSPQGEASAAAARPVTLTQPLGSRTAPDYRAIVAQNKPAVVGITSESTVPVEPPFGPPFGDKDPASAQAGGNELACTIRSAHCGRRFYMRERRPDLGVTNGWS